MTPEASPGFPDSFPMGPLPDWSAYGNSWCLRRDRQIDDVDSRHPRHGWALPQPCDQGVDHRVVAARLHLDGAVELIAHPSVEAESTPLMGCRCPKPDALHAASDDNA